jgi:hypothetical protein
MLIAIPVKNNIRKYSGMSQEFKKRCRKYSGKKERRKFFKIIIRKYSGKKETKI